jgi:hypothetical protein
MFRSITPRHLVVAVIVASTVVFAGVGYAARGPLPQHDPPCTINPSPAAVGQMYAVSATELPTTAPVWLITGRPDGSSTVSQVYVDSDGSWTGPRSSDQAGAWTYTFSGLMANKKYAAVSTCSVEVS